MKETAIHGGMFGRVRVDNELSEMYPDVVDIILSKGDLQKCTALEHLNSIEYLLESEIFDELKLGEEIPLYVLSLKYDSNGDIYIDNIFRKRIEVD